ncbi:MHC class I polypeptide-related sequence B-like, partial [Elephas maximus indicus]|uniref:MHC class I polypeptide-related sequence B-like n=1 Tax=Elephas maximus indicus TaxID=99487 RepID=UPI002116355F
RVSGQRRKARAAKRQAKPHDKPWQFAVSVFFLDPAVATKVCVEPGVPRPYARESRNKGHYSLLYQIKVISQDGFIEPGFLAEGYLNGKPYLHYDHKKDRAEPRGPWAEAHLGAETWDAENKDLTDMGKKLRMTLSDIMKLQDQKGGLHSFQEMLHCETQEDYSSMGIWDYCYDGEPFLSYDPGTQRWMAPLSSTQTLALEIKKTWDTDGDKHKYYHHHVQGDICKRLWSYSTSGRNFMERTVPPAVNVTLSKVVKGNVTLMCRAAGFYPWKITLTWLQDKEPLSTDSQNHGCILPDGNGTYETWVSTRLPQGEEQRYSCYVEHSGKNFTQSVSNGGSSVQASVIAIVFAAAIVFAFVL